MATARPTVGPRVEVDGLKEYKQAISELNASNKTLSAELKLLQAQYKGNTESSEYLTKKGELLQRQLDQQKEKVEQLHKAMQESARVNGEANTQTQALATSYANAQRQVLELEEAIQENNDAMNGETETMLGLGDTVDSVASKLGINLPQGAKDALNGMQGLSAGSVAAMAAVAAAVVKVIKELHDMTVEVAHDVDELVSESMITGVSTTMLQAWDYAAPLIDVDAETIKGSMTKLTKAMGDAKGGSEKAQQAFSDLGVSIENSDGSLRSAEEVFYDVIDALGQVEGQTERDAMAMDLLGKSAQDLNPLIVAGSGALQELAEEAEAVGYILDESQIEKLAEVDDAYQRMQLQLEATKKQLAAQFAPAAQSTMELFTKAVKMASDALINSGIVENLANVIKELMSIASSVVDIIGQSPGVKTAMAEISAALKGLYMVLALVADTAQVVVGLMQMLSGNFSGGWNTMKTALGANMSNGELSHYQRAIGKDEGNWYNPNTGSWEGNYGHNATGNDYWGGGYTWVGESGPEIAYLPAGSSIMTAQESRDAVGGDVINISVDVGSLEDLESLIRWAKSQKIRGRMR